MKNKNKKTIELKKAAMKIYPNAFNKDTSLNEDYSLNDLLSDARMELFDKFIGIVSSLSNLNYEEFEEIYEYMECEIIKRDKLLKPNCDSIKKVDFKKEMELRDKAIDHYPRAFTQSFDLDEGYSLDYLNAETKRTLFVGTKELAFSNNREVYEYVKSLIENGKAEKFDSYVQCFYEAINMAIDRIGIYSFNARSVNTCGDNQSESNKELLRDLSLLRPIIDGMLKSINDFIIATEYKRVSDIYNDELSSFRTELIMRLAVLSGILTIDSIALDRAKVEYHDNWKRTCKPESISEKRSYSELGKSRKQWRKTKNDVCHDVLAFIKGLEELNMAVYYRTFDYEKCDYGLDEEMVSLTEGYNYGMERIQSSPYYFCYLTEEEKNEIREESLQRKLQQRNR